MGWLIFIAIVIFWIAARVVVDIVSTLTKSSKERQSDKAVIRLLESIKFELKKELEEAKSELRFSEEREHELQGVVDVLNGREPNTGNWE